MSQLWANSRSIGEMRHLSAPVTIDWWSYQNNNTFADQMITLYPVCSVYIRYFLLWTSELRSDVCLFHVTMKFTPCLFPILAYTMHPRLYSLVGMLHQLILIIIVLESFALKSYPVYSIECVVYCLFYYSTVYGILYHSMTHSLALIKIIFVQDFIIIIKSEILLGIARYI